MDYYLSNHEGMEENEAPKAKVSAPINSNIGHVRKKS